MLKNSQYNKWKALLDAHNENTYNQQDIVKYKDPLYMVFEPHPDFESWQTHLVCVKVYAGNACVAEINGIQDLEINESWFNGLKPVPTTFEVHINDIQFNVNEVIVKFDRPELEEDTLDLIINTEEDLDTAFFYLDRMIKEKQPYMQKIWNESFETINEDPFPVKSK